jgi:spore maturation protein A
MGNPVVLSTRKTRYGKVQNLSSGCIFLKARTYLLPGDFMLNYIWAALIVISVVVGFVSGRTAEVSAGILESAKTAVNVVIGLTGMMCFWTGMSAILEKSSAVKSLSEIIEPVINLLFPKIKKKSKAKEKIVMNICANVLGMGNAATPLGLEAMKELDRINPSTDASSSMRLFIVINTCSFQLIPTSVITLRHNAGAANPYDIIIPVWITSFLTLLFGILLCKLLDRSRRFEI